MDINFSIHTAVNEEKEKKKKQSIELMPKRSDFVLNSCSFFVLASWRIKYPGRYPAQ